MSGQPSKQSKWESQRSQPVLRAAVAVEAIAVQAIAERSEVEA